MDWKDVGRVAAQTAPILAGVLGGPAGAIAGAAGSLIGSFLGVEPTADAVIKALGDPNQLLRLAELEARHEEALLAWRRAQLEASVDNVHSARERETRLANLGHGGAWASAVVSLIVVCGFFWMLHAVITMSSVNEPALLLLGSLGSAFGAVVNYYLGSSFINGGSGGNGGNQLTGSSFSGASTFSAVKPRAWFGKK